MPGQSFAAATRSQAPPGNARDRGSASSLIQLVPPNQASGNEAEPLVLKFQGRALERVERMPRCQRV